MGDSEQNIFDTLGLWFRPDKSDLDFLLDSTIEDSLEDLMSSIRPSPRLGLEGNIMSEASDSLCVHLQDIHKIVLASLKCAKQ